jgi:ABC-2 type transport system permease protein
MRLSVADGWRITMNSLENPGTLKSAPARYASLYGAMWRNSVVRDMSFKANFLLWIVVELLWFALQLGFFAVIYSHTDHIGDWTKWQVVLLIGTSHFVQQIFQAFFLTNITQLSELIRTGKLDFMLLLPVNTRFIVSLRQVDLGGFVNAGSALAVVIFAMSKLGIVPGIADVIWYLLLILSGVLIHYSLMLLLSTLSFWTVRAQGIVWGYYSLFNIARYPDAAFRGAFKIIFTFALPMLLIGNVPARLLASTLENPWRMGLVFGMCAVCFIVSEAGWRFALKRYTSASS